MKKGCILAQTPCWQQQPRQWSAAFMPLHAPKFMDSLVARGSHLRGGALISTVALARCEDALTRDKPFERFLAPDEKPLKRLTLPCVSQHRAKAAVSMRCHAGSYEISGPKGPLIALRTLKRLKSRAPAGRRAQHASRDKHGVGAGLLLLWASLILASSARPALGAPAAAAEEVLTKQQPAEMYDKLGDVRFKPVSGTEMTAALPQPVGFDEALRTLDLSRAALRLTDLSYVRLKERTRLEIVRQPAATNAPLVKIYHGDAYVMSRGIISIPTETPNARGVPKGTEFLVSVSPDGGESVFTMFDGEVDLSDVAGHAPVRVHRGEQGIATAGQPIRVRPILLATNIIQWWIYYPGVLDLEDIGLTPEARTRLSASLARYQEGNLAQALEQFPGYPQLQEPSSSEERLYLAGLLLAVGAPDRAEAQLARANTNAPAARALRTMIHAVGARTALSARASGLSSPLPRRATASMNADEAVRDSSSELLALSYEYQARHELEPALAAARASVKRSPNFGFGWARVAELEFSFGRAGAAHEAIQRALALAPRNANAHTIKGFVLAARNDIRPAIAEFDEAIRLDPSLGNAWLGRGLCKRRLGWFQTRPLTPALSPSEGERENRQADWLSDLQAAAAAEPHRALLRSYAGKGFAEAGDTRLAEKELHFARDLDPNDPTPWLYEALLEQQMNRINPAISDLETSQELNTNRSLFRSRLLLDEDRAVSSANLASIYRDAGMSEVSVREAARAVTYDYASDSAHLFLSDSYNELRDPTRFNLRYETVWFNELLLANLLAPIGGGRLSQHLSQQEYSKLFEADGLGFANSTTARTDKMLTELASQYGTFGGTSYAMDLEYHLNDGVRPNNDLDSIEWYTTIKQQVTPEDTALVLVKYEDYHSGDNFQYYNPYDPNHHFRPDFRFDEYQHPIAVAGWHHEWSPGMHTLLLGGHLENEQFFSDRQAPQLVFDEAAPGSFLDTYVVPFDVKYRNELDIYTVELNQVLQWERITLSAGARYQSGGFKANAVLDNPTPPFLFIGNPTSTVSDEDFERITGYGYLTLEPVDRLWLTGGLAYDDLTYPSNFRNPPLSPGQDNRERIGPKAALVWSPIPEATLRGAFSRSLGGVSLDESFRLEPTQLAGFPQSFRSLISESLVGSVAAPEYQTYGLALDLKFPERTYAGIQVERLESDLSREVGVFSSTNGQLAHYNSTTTERLNYREDAVSLNVNQLLGDQFVLGAAYRLAQVDLLDQYPDVPTADINEALPDANHTVHSLLHRATGYLLFNHPSGFFTRAEAHWYHQHNSGYATPLPGDDFVQENIFAGFRFARRRAELELGLLNLSGGDYHLNPLTPYAELPRKRVFQARLAFQF
ncbi:MAG: hypothetical protein C5B50_00085 [Verrucomicrobia bacterium]|nr:MAG: hypothetical protein C5B50_00085 [Verrucomicrobiota bacterium]